MLCLAHNTTPFSSTTPPLSKAIVATRQLRATRLESPFPLFLCNVVGSVARWQIKGSSTRCRRGTISCNCPDACPPTHRVLFFFAGAQYPPLVNGPSQLPCRADPLRVPILRNSKSGPPRVDDESMPMTKLICHSDVLPPIPSQDPTV
jgi:hypothetical protein